KTGLLDQLSKPTISTSIKNVRRLAVTKQRLAGRLPSRATREHILSVVRDLCYVQWDPIEAVAPSHIIALWSRIGNFRLSDLGALSSIDDRRRDDRGPSGKPEHLGPIRKIPPLLGGEEESDGRRLRARGGPESHPSPRHSLPPRDSRVFSARPLSEPEEEFRT